MQAIDAPRRKLSDIFSKDEIALLTARSDWMGWRALLFTWGVIGLTFVALARWPHPLTWLAALVILGGRQLSLAIMMHDAAHGTLFRTRWLNDVLADYACGSAVGIDIRRYRQHHLVHHSKTGTEADTDRSLSAPFPASRASLARKFLRDLSGISGLKREYGLLLMHAGVLRWTVASDVVMLPQQGRTWRNYLGDTARNMWKPLALHLMLFGMLWAAGHPAALPGLDRRLPDHLQPVHADPLDGRARLHRGEHRHAAQYPLDPRRPAGARHRGAAAGEPPHRASPDAGGAVFPAAGDAPDAARARPGRRAARLSGRHQDRLRAPGVMPGLICPRQFWSRFLHRFGSPAPFAPRHHAHWAGRLKNRCAQLTKFN